MATVTAESLGLSNLTPDQMAAAQQPAMGYNTQAALTPIYSGQSSYFGTPQITGYSGADGTQYNAQGQVTGAASLNGQVYSFDPSTGAVTYQEKADGGGLGATLKNVASSPVIQIAAAVALPGIGEALAPSIMAATTTAEGVATLTAAQAAAVGSAAASVVIQTAQGVPIEKAIENAGVNLLVQTQSQPVVQSLSKSLQNLDVASAVANTTASMVTSAGASALTAAVQGKSPDEIARAAEGAAVGGAAGAGLYSNDAVTLQQGQVISSVLGTALGTGNIVSTLMSAGQQLGDYLSKPVAQASPYTATTQVEPGADSPQLPPGTGVASTGPIRDDSSPTGFSDAKGNPINQDGTAYNAAATPASTPDANVAVTGAKDAVVPVATTTPTAPTTTPSTPTQPNVTVTGAKDANVAVANNTAALINQIGLNNAAPVTSPVTPVTPPENVTVTAAKDAALPVADANTAAILAQSGITPAPAPTPSPAPAPAPVTTPETVEVTASKEIPTTTPETPVTPPAAPAPPPPPPAITGASPASGTTPSETVEVVGEKEVPVVQPSGAVTPSTPGSVAGPLVPPTSSAIAGGNTPPLQNVEVVDTRQNIPTTDQAILDLISSSKPTPSAGTVEVVGSRDVPTAVTGTSGSSAPSAGTVEVVGQRDIPTSNAAVTGAGPTSVADAGTVVVTDNREIPTSQPSIAGASATPGLASVDVVAPKEIPTADTAIKNYGNIDVVAPREIPTAQDNVVVTGSKDIPTANTTPEFIPQTVDSSQVANVQAPELSNIPLSITAGPSKTASLARALGVAPQITTGTTQGLTSGGEGGEIQSLETGKPRRSVWNESSLRLRDALGLE